VIPEDFLKQEQEKEAKERENLGKGKRVRKQVIKYTERGGSDVDDSEGKSDKVIEL
jgi:hypothetical protein